MQSRPVYYSKSNPFNLLQVFMAVQLTDTLYQKPLENSKWQALANESLSDSNVCAC